MRLLEGEPASCFFGFFFKVLPHEPLGVTLRMSTGIWIDNPVDVVHLDFQKGFDIGPNHIQLSRTVPMGQGYFKNRDTGSHYQSEKKLLDYMAQKALKGRFIGPDSANHST